MKETPEQREKRQAEERPTPQSKVNRLISDSIKEANNADANSGKGTDQAPVSK